MSEFRVSKKTRKWQRITAKQAEMYRDKVYLFLAHNPTRMMTVLDIAREIVKDHKDEAEVARAARIIRNMEAQRLIGKQGGAVKAYWSKVNKVANIEPTYTKPTPVEQEEDETQEPEIQSETKTDEIEDKAESPTVKVPVTQGPIFQDVIPVRRQPVHVDRTPRRITITIDL